MSESTSELPLERIVKNRNVQHARVITPVGGPSLTKQAMKKDCDINLIVKRHAQTGMWDHLNNVRPTYGDTTGSVELAAAIGLVERADDNFDKLPAAVRRVVDNDPHKFLEALSDEGGFRALVEAGLPVDKGDRPIEVVVTNPPAEPGPEPTPPEGE